MGRLRIVAACLALCASLACSATSGTNTATTRPATSADAPPPPVKFDAKPGGADGFVFVDLTRPNEARSADGWRVGGVALTRDTTAPAGFAPFNQGVELDVADTNAFVQQAKPDSQGKVSFANVPAGHYKVRVLTATPQDFALTIIGGATVRWGSYPVSRAAAFETAKREVGSFVREGTTLIASPPTPLPAGVVVGPALGDDDGKQSAALETTVAKPSWFFYVDPFTDQKFHHAVKYVFVEAESGQATVKDATSWPAFNHMSYYRTSDSLASSTDLLLRPSDKAPSAMGPSLGPVRVEAETFAARAVSGGAMPRDLAPMFDHVPGCTSARTYALLVQGADEGPMRADMDQIKTFFGHGGIPAASVRQWKPTAGKSPRTEINAMWAQIKSEATPCDYIFVFVTSHGNRNGSEQLDTDATNKDGSPVGYESWNPTYLDWSGCKACHITVIIDACYSGKTLQDLQKTFTPMTGRKVVVMASSDARHESGSYTWYNLRGRTGGAFTNAVVDAFNTQSAGGATVSLGKVFDEANTTVASTVFTKAIREQNPQYWERPLAPGETCPGLASATPGTQTQAPSQSPNRPPKIARFYATFERPTTTYHVEASDPDGDALTYAWSFNVACGTTAGGNSTTATWSHPDRSIGGNCPDEPVHAGSITVTVTDGKGGQDTFTWTRGSDVGETRP